MLGTSKSNCLATLKNSPPYCTVINDSYENENYLLYNVLQVDQLKIALQQLIPAEYIALHGMKGFGKSCLAASTLKDAKLVKDLFAV